MKREGKAYKAFEALLTLLFGAALIAIPVTAVALAYAAVRWALGI